AVALSEGRQGAQGGQGVAGAGLGVKRPGGGGQAQAAGDVPDGDGPALLPGVLHDLPLGLVGFAGLDPQSGEGSVDVVGKLFGQLHEDQVLSLGVRGVGYLQGARTRPQEARGRLPGAVEWEQTSYCWICCVAAVVAKYSAVLWSAVATPRACSTNLLAW